MTSARISCFHGVSAFQTLWSPKTATTPRAPHIHEQGRFPPCDAVLMNGQGGAARGAKRSDVPRSEQVRQAVTWGLSSTVAQALERLDEPGLDPITVAVEIDQWRKVCSAPRSELAKPNNDWAEIIGPMARNRLESAIQAFDRASAAPLRREVSQLDVKFEDKTLNDPDLDPSLPWWSRRRSR